MAPRGIIALDLSTRTGVAHDGPDPGRPVTSTIILPSAMRATDGGYDLGRAFALFRSRLCDLIGVVTPALVCFEAPLQVIGSHASSRPTNQLTVRILFGLAAITEEICATLEIPCCEVNISTAKKHFAGHGRAEKADIKRRCELLGWAPRNYDEADACALWSLAKSLRDPRWSPSSTPLFGRARA